ncbi:Transcription antitermination factor NusG [Mariniphaga anaerophila]|uniref:Transcription antitermination factor NusG n=1 Tax=Mariniphaga anaerophila TaxID=1484053 RepID=A0A1M5AKJ0_9BACT|nr:UpxY family transcription antiterminator [Mariniphaga anaerophila]SHF30820.1 Transcription antitermination factor NusG [Mariniphaga anaerophila]
MNNPVNQKEWHVVYTRSRAEKKVFTNLTQKNIECFLPLQKKLRQWKDRKKWVEMPLISSYCFVHINRKENDKVLQTDNVVCFITFEGKPAKIPQCQIDVLRRITAQNDFQVEVSRESFQPGKKVEILCGPLIGVQGELVSVRGKDRFIIRVEQIETAFCVEVPAEQLTVALETVCR